MERREMIEEILGLREYQLKKADAERRLKNSRINLDKTKALVEEIVPHLRSLKRQTGRWERRGELAEELRNLENEFFGSQLADIAERITTIEARIKEQRETARPLGSRAARPPKSGRHRWKRASRRKKKNCRESKKRSGLLWSAEACCKKTSVGSKRRWKWRRCRRREAATPPTNCWILSGK